MLQGSTDWDPGPSSMPGSEGQKPRRARLIYVAMKILHNEICHRIFFNHVPGVSNDQIPEDLIKSSFVTLTQCNFPLGQSPSRLFSGIASKITSPWLLCHSLSFIFLSYFVRAVDSFAWLSWVWKTSFIMVYSNDWDSNSVVWCNSGCTLQVSSLLKVQIDHCYQLV